MECLDSETFKGKIFDYGTQRVWKYAGARPSIVDFYADWCGPCRALGPVLEEVSREYAGKVDVFKVNVDQAPEVAQAFGVNGVPTLLFIPKEGKPAFAVGALPKNRITEAIASVLGVRPP